MNRTDKMGKKLCIIGTGTDTGKTYAAGLILKKLHGSGVTAGYFKAAMSGNIRDARGTLIPGDALHVKRFSCLDQPLEEMCPYVYESPFSPHLASRLEGNPLCMERVLEKFRRACKVYEYLTIEGSGGILCPLRFDAQEIWLADIIKAFGVGCLLIADAGLGAINSVGLTAFYLKKQDIPLKGIILNHFQPGNIMHEDNQKMCESLSGVKVVAHIGTGDEELDIPAERLQTLYE